MPRRHGTVERQNQLDQIMATLITKDQRRRVSKVMTDSGVSLERADLVSEHLKWGLSQLRTRGWTNEDWGFLLTGDGQIGDGPICILESVRAGFDCPGSLYDESTEQKYLRYAFVQLGWQPPGYVSIWNDEQTSFGDVETLMLKAIETAELDEANGFDRFANVRPLDLPRMFGITDEVLAKARAAVNTEYPKDAPVH